MSLVGPILSLLGSLFVLLAATGLLRMPDVMTRMHSSTKAGTLGTGLIFGAAVFHFGDIGVATRAIAAIVFMVLTAPIGAHVIGRAAYFYGTKLWENTIVDELKIKRSEYGDTYHIGPRQSPAEPGA